MSADAIAAAALGPVAATAPASPSQSLAESFNAAWQRAELRQSSDTGTASLEQLLSPLLSLGERSAALEAEAAPLAGAEFKPSQLMMVTMRSHEFLFRCELTANVANRASDGVQQLFRQQS